MAASALLAEPIARLPAKPASAVKKDGWRGVVRSLAAAEGRLVVTNHDEPEAVIMTVAEYTRIIDALNAAQAAVPDPVEELRRSFDQRLAALSAPDAAERLRSVMRNPGPLAGRVKAGSTF
ncbi:hypothetical protein ACOTH1_21895 [Achromobacter ruhlandii]|uniref:hypothetical protein n=1 Tax=Achromobacter ruhlandii TaxID=72557 RepID=UPI003B9D6FDD